MTRSLPRVSAAEFAKLLGVSPASVSNWMDEGMPAVRPGRQRKVVQIDLAAALPWVMSRREPPGSQRERLAKEQADKIALENERRRGSLIYADQVAEVLSKLGAELAARHDAVSGRLAGEVAGLTDAGAIRTRLLDELRAVRAAFADAATELADALGSAPEAGDGSAPAAKAKPAPVGRRGARAAARKPRARAVQE